MAELEKLINASLLSAEDKELWLKTIQNADDELIAVLVDYLRNFPDKISWYTGILKRKIEAMKNNDPLEWDKIIKEEEEELKKMVTE